MIPRFDTRSNFHLAFWRATRTTRSLRLIMAMACVVTALNGCVYHYCGPAYPNSTDPFCKIYFPAPMM